MDTRLAAVKCLIKIIEQNKTYDEAINFYADKAKNGHSKDLKLTLDDYCHSELVNLVSGAVKYKLTLDFFIESVSSRSKISPPIRNILRAGIYELEYLKNPDYAVINSYVEIAKKYDKNSSGFVNAVLRNFLRLHESIPSPYSLNIKYSHPEWLVDRWISNYGTEETIKICEFNNKIPVLSIRINQLKTSKEKLIDLFKENNIEFTESNISEECLILKNTGNIKNIFGFKEGLWMVQGESSSLVAKILDPQPNERILDVCAAPGGKTTHIAALMHDTGEIVAVDASKDRIKKIEENCQRLGINSVKTIVADAGIYNDNCRFDRILIDAPCSNTGVFVKRPDARWKRKPEDIKKLTDIQLKILENTSKLLKSGGMLVYSTCSIEPEENLLLIQKFLQNNSNFIFEDISKYLSFINDGNGKDGYIQILQSKNNTDGFFIAKLKKL